MLLIRGGFTQRCDHGTVTIGYGGLRQVTASERKRTYDIRAITRLIASESKEF